MLTKIMWNIVIEKIETRRKKRQEIFILLHSRPNVAQRVFQLTCRC